MNGWKIAKTESKKMQKTKSCNFCEVESGANKQFWSLRDYYGVSGYFCGKCYDKISHNSYGQPNYPAEYTAFLLKFG